MQISKRKRKTMYRSVANCEFDKAELLLYEEVTRMPPFRRKTLVLIGVSGVGRRTLKNRLINSDVDKFGAVIPRNSMSLRLYWTPLTSSSFNRHQSAQAGLGGEWR